MAIILRTHQEVIIRQNIKPLTSIDFVECIISQREHKQWLWKFPEEELGNVSEMNLRGIHAQIYL